MPATTLYGRELRLYLQERELIHRHSWPNRQRARSAILEYVEGFYDTRRRHSALGHLSPAEYEEARLRGGAVA
jgi:transposase InsO family protein